MTSREEKFFKRLVKIFGEKCYVCPQIHLSALLEHRIRGQSWRGAFSHINGKSVDFVLIRVRDLSVMCVVELDDKTHDSESRVKRDMEVERILSEAEIPLARVRHVERMSDQEVADILNRVINAN